MKKSWKKTLALIEERHSDGELSEGKYQGNPGSHRQGSRERLGRSREAGVRVSRAVRRSRIVFQLSEERAESYFSELTMSAPRSGMETVLTRERGNEALRLRRRAVDFVRQNHAGASTGSKV